MKQWQKDALLLRDFYGSPEEASSAMGVAVEEYNDALNGSVVPWFENLLREEASVVEIEKQNKEPLGVQKALDSLGMSVTMTKCCRKRLDEALQGVRDLGKSRETSLAITKIQEAIMWLGMELKRLNDGKSCYSEGLNPDSTVVHPVADDLKL